MARPRKDIDTRQVEALAAIGCSGEEIAAVIGCARSTIYERFRTVIEKGHQKRNASVRRAQYEVGVKKHNATMLIWLGKQYLGQTDKVETRGTLSVSGNLFDGADIERLAPIEDAAEPVEGGESSAEADVSSWPG